MITVVGESGSDIQTGTKSQTGGESFAAAMTSWMKDVNSDQVKAAKTMTDLAVEGKGSIHEAMVSINNAQGSFRLLMEMRNRVVETVNRLLESGR